MSSNFRSISNGVKRWTPRLKGKGNDKDHFDFMVSKFQCHMEDGIFHSPVTDIQDRLSVPTSAYTGAVLYSDTNTKSTGGTKIVNKSVNTRFPKQTQLPHPKEHLISQATQPVLWKGTPRKLWIDIAPDANQNTAIPWCE